MRYLKITNKEIIKAEHCEAVLNQYYSKEITFAPWIAEEYNKGNLLIVVDTIFAKCPGGKITKGKGRNWLIKNLHTKDFKIVAERTFKATYRTLQEELEIIKRNKLKNK